MRSFLTRNEIFIKTAGYILISVLGVWLAFQANTIATRQTQIAAEQSQILKREQMPIVSMVVRLEYDEQTEMYASEALDVYNDGSPLRDLTIEKGVFLLVEYGTDYGAAEKALVPISDYYLATLHYSQRTGLLATLFLEHNRALSSALDVSFREYARTQGKVGSLYVLRYIQVGYTDVFGEEHSEIFYVDPISGCSEISGIQRLAVIQALGLFREPGMAIGLESATPEEVLMKSELFRSVKKGTYPIVHLLW